MEVEVVVWGLLDGFGAFERVCRVVGTLGILGITWYVLWSDRGQYGVVICE